MGPILPPVALLGAVLCFFPMVASATDTAAAPRLPHIIHILADDYGWADVGYHRDAAHASDVSTPNLDRLVGTGIELDRFYAHKICSPSRCAIQSGRHPIHVNVQNVNPNVANPRDPVGGYQGIPKNMTGIAQIMKRAGYRTHIVGKWDVGMATPQHSPFARGYDSWLGYWHHANDYWSFDEDSCPGPAPPRGAARAEDGASPLASHPVRDLWRANATHDPLGAPARDLQPIMILQRTFLD